MSELKTIPEMQSSLYHIPIVRDPDVCIGCNTCVETCMHDVHIPSQETGAPPIVRFPDDCWYCGCCVMECPLKEEGAIKLVWPMQINLQWKRKETGEIFRIGQANPPKPVTTPPVGGWTILRDSQYK